MTDDRWVNDIYKTPTSGNGLRGIKKATGDLHTAVEIHRVTMMKNKKKKKKKNMQKLFGKNNFSNEFSI